MKDFQRAMSEMEVDDTGPVASLSENKKRFEIKKWYAVALWAWDIVVDNCAICRNHIMDLCLLGLFSPHNIRNRY